jgi:ADP-dependent NAD(P)H-hydrate dehydratase / NAD(P)H-hydrate epimerase
VTSPQLLYSVAQVRAIDARAIAEGTSGYTLMRRAAEAALRALRSRWPRAMSVVVVTGSGNNGGDGYVLARFAQAAGLAATVLAAVPPDQLKGEARTACDEFIASGGRLVPYVPERLTDGDVIVDALLGTGLAAQVRSPLAQVIQHINATGLPVLALDIPSGLNGDSGAVMGTTVRADCTLSFVALKTGLFLDAGPEHVGRLLFDDLGVTVPEEPEFRPVLERLGEADVLRALPPRRHAANKGDFGRVLIIGGGPGMPGAVRLAGEACLRSGAGLVVAATAPENLPAIVAGRPEMIVHGVGTAEDLTPLLQNAHVVVVGPGLGRTPWAHALLQKALGAGRPLVLDADALNLIAEQRLRAPAGAVLTPHPGEAARLLGTSTGAVQTDRRAALEALSAAHPGAIVVLKGAGTLIGVRGSKPPVPAICERGNPAMAAAGMGDVLTGAIAGILAQCGDPWLAARAGVMAHALAGDELARDRERGILALELAEGLSHWVNLKR